MLRRVGHRCPPAPGFSDSPSRIYPDDVLDQGRVRRAGDGASRRRGERGSCPRRRRGRPHLPRIHRRCGGPAARLPRASRAAAPPRRAGRVAPGRARRLHARAPGRGHQHGRGGARPRGRDRPDRVHHGRPGARPRLRPRGRAGPRSLPHQAALDPRTGVHRPHPERHETGRPRAASSKDEANGESHCMTLEIQNLHVRTEEREILHGVDLVVKRGETHALMGPNGSGKSTLANTLMGNPVYEVTDGRVLLNGEDLTEADPDERAKAGLFMAFQYPATIPGVSVANFLRMAVNAKREEPIKVKEFGALLKEHMELLRIDPAFNSRYLNEGFSGGEKKRAEILQLAMLRPEIAVLDETDSGLDVDALRIVSEGVNALRGPDMGALIITHYRRILDYVKPDFVHIMLDGRIVREGGPELADELEDKGYEWVREEVATSAS